MSSDGSSETEGAEGAEGTETTATGDPHITTLSGVMYTL